MSTLLWLLGSLVLSGLVVLLVAFWRRPLDFVHAARRRALGKIAERRQIRGSRGKLVYWVAGPPASPEHAPPVILLHGAGDHAGTWARIARELAGRGAGAAVEARLLVPDQPGHYDSEPDPDSGPLTLGDVLAGLEALVEAESPEEPVTLVGNSMGAWVALLFAHRHPGRVERLVLEDGGGVGEIAVSLQPENRDQARELMEAVLGPDTPVPGGFVLDHLQRRTASGPIAALSVADSEPYRLDDRLGEIEVPVTLIWGQDDGVLPLEIGERMERQLPRAELVVLPRCGHIPHLECPEAFLEVVRRVLGGGEGVDPGKEEEK